ncbi:MAG: DNA-3-methyladenine glycosylase I [Nitrososphaerota archaeon]|nr:DNA-3-methyladenine glycosylase I [Nitrososphaerota archaeon]
MSRLKRCGWASMGDPTYRAYHDREWGVPLHADRKIFEFLVLEGFQAGLSWSTILKKRRNFRRAFDGFDPKRVSRYDEGKVSELMADAGIVRNELKIRSAIGNATAFLEVQTEFGRFDSYIWRFVGNRPIINRWHSPREIPARTEISDGLSRDLAGRGFRFVGSTICYAHMQATGMVNDHTVDCFRYKQLGG